MKDYWKELNDEYLNFPKEETDKNILEWSEEWGKKSQKLLDKYGNISWLMLEAANMLRNEDISEGKFRELVRFCLDKELKDKKEVNLKKQLKDLKNKYSSWLTTEQGVKLGKTINQEEVIKLRAKLEALQELEKKLWK